MKAIIPVAGAGTKLRPHTYTQPKALIPMAGKTVLGVILDALTDESIDEYIFVIGYLGDKIQAYVSSNYPHLKCSFVTQNDRRGTGHAIWLTKEVVKNDEILIVFGDTICDFDLGELLRSPQSRIGVRRVEDPRNFGVAELDAGSQVLRVVEKPLIPKSNLAMVGIYKIKESNLMFEALDKYLGSTAEADGEYHLTHALQTMLDQGVVFEGFQVNNWFDCGKKEAILETNATLLRTMNNRNGAERFKNTVIIPPVHIAAGCQIENSIVGPSVSIGENSIIRSAIVRDSIIGSFAELEEVVLKQSIIGSDAYVHGLSQSLNIGDNTEIDLG